MKLTAVRYIIQVQITDSRWVVDAIFIWQIIAIVTLHQPLIFQVPMVKIKEALTSLWLAIVRFRLVK